MRIYYDPRQSRVTSSYSPSSSKPESFVDAAIDSGMNVRIHPFSPLLREDLYEIHDPAFVNSVFSGLEANGFGTYEEKIAATCLWTGGSICSAALAALDEGIACSPTSGFHHSGYDYCWGFCTFNSLMLASKWVHEECGLKVAIVDLDYHDGDGCKSIKDELSMDWLSYFSASEWSNEHQFLADLPGRLQEAAGDAGLVMYQAGADSWENDPLGGYMTLEGLKERDRIVFDFCASNGIGCCWNLAGGYAKEEDGSIPQVLEIHLETLRQASIRYGELVF